MIRLLIALTFTFTLWSCGAYDRRTCYSAGADCHGSQEPDVPPTEIAGPAGPAGPMGQAGANGAQGERGVAGERGMSGDRGSVGPAGADGQAGMAGPSGVQGDKGDTGEVGAAGSAGPIGPQGSPGSVGATGSPGADGSPGRDGVDGVDGATGPAGATGATGPASTSPYDIVAIEDPCGVNSLDEVFLRLRNGTLLAHYSDGTRQHLVIVLPGSYTTTDGWSCPFTMNPDGSLSW